MRLQTTDHFMNLHQMCSKRPNYVVYFILWTGTEELGCLTISGTRPGAVSVMSVLPPPLNHWEVDRGVVIGWAGSIWRVLTISTNDASLVSARTSRSSGIQSHELHETLLTGRFSENERRGRHSRIQSQHDEGLTYLQMQWQQYKPSWRCERRGGGWKNVHLLTHTPARGMGKNVIRIRIITIIEAHCQTIVFLLIAVIFFIT